MLPPLLCGMLWGEAEGSAESKGAPGKGGAAMRWSNRSPESSVKVKHLLPVFVLLILAAVAPAACSEDRDGEPEAAAGENASQAEDTSSEEAAAEEETAPAQEGKKEEKWSPPRFTARREERDEMVRIIRRYGLKDKAVLEAMSHVPRHEFVPDRLASSAYADHPLPIGHGQTISQPFMVAEMTRRLKLRPDSRVLEIGTGSGYQAAVLTEFTRHVKTIEIVKPLAEAAGRRLRKLGYTVVDVRQGDGYYGWPEGGPFDAIIVTCAAGQIPPPLLKQLAPGGRMVIPVGRAYAVQTLMLVEKDDEGRTRSRALMGVAFVPLLRKDPTAEEK